MLYDPEPVVAALVVSAVPKMRSTAYSPYSPTKNFTSAYSKRSRTTTARPPDDYDHPEYPEYAPPPEPCTLFWDDECSRVGLNPFTLEISLVLLLLLPHISMIIFLILQGRRESAFRGAFYVLFVSVSVVDCLQMALVRIVAHNKAKKKCRVQLLLSPPFY